MKKIDKSNTVPKSLNNKTTNKRRKEIIEIGEYPTANNIALFPAKNVGTYDSRYKQNDTKTALNKLYNGKCGYCETKNRQLAVEHYRPKSEYYWLAYSWDNLLYSCPICNSRKLNKFLIKNTKLQHNEIDINEIHKLSSKYNEYEQPELINPETEDIFNDIIYKKNGEYDTEKITNQRLLATIRLLRLNDPEDLSINRKAVYDKLEQAICEKVYEIKQGVEVKKNKIRIEQIIETFIKDIDNEFHTFRKYIIKNWINKMIN